MMQWLDIPIPAYVRTDKLLLSHKAVPGRYFKADPHLQQQQQQEEEDQQQQGQQQLQTANTCQADSTTDLTWTFSLSVCSVHGEQCPLPMFAAARVHFYDQAQLAPRLDQAARNHSSHAAAGAAATAAPGTEPSVEAAAQLAAGFEQTAGSFNTEGLQEVLPSGELAGPAPWKISRVCSSALRELAVVVHLQMSHAADEDKRQQQVCWCAWRIQTYCWLLGSLERTRLQTIHHCVAQLIHPCT